VTLQDERGGLLGKGGILLVTSHADPHLAGGAGKWILENLIGTPPPPAPPKSRRSRRTIRRPRSRWGADGAPPGEPGLLGLPQGHDPLGLALETSTPSGGGDRDAGVTIDASGELNNGTRVDGVVALRRP